MRYLKTNTATRVTVGPFLDKTDGITPETALTATNEKLTFVVDDAGVPTLVLDTTATASGGSNDFVHITNDDSGYYDLELAAANVNYLGRAVLSITYATDHCPVFHEFMILPAGEYDRLTATTGPIPDLGITDRGTAAGIASGTITLRSGHGISNTSASVVRLVSGTNALGKSRIISYSGSGDVFNVDPAWDANGETTPSGTIVYIVQDLPPSPTSTVASVTLTSGGITALWAQLNASNVTAGSVGKKLADLGVGADGYLLLSAETHTGATIPTVTSSGLSAAAVDDIWDEQVDGTVTARQSLRLANSANGGKVSGMATTSIAVRDLADSKDRIAATVDANGNRSAVTLTLT